MALAEIFAEQAEFFRYSPTVLTSASAIIDQFVKIGWIDLSTDLSDKLKFLPEIGTVVAEKVLNWPVIQGISNEITKHCVLAAIGKKASPHHYTSVGYYDLMPPSAQLSPLPTIKEIALAAAGAAGRNPKKFHALYHCHQDSNGAIGKGNVHTDSGATDTILFRDGGQIDIAKVAKFWELAGGWKPLEAEELFEACRKKNLIESIKLDATSFAVFDGWRHPHQGVGGTSFASTFSF